MGVLPHIVPKIQLRTKHLNVPKCEMQTGVGKDFVGKTQKELTKKEKTW